MVSVTFMVNFYYIYGWLITFMVFITFMGDTAVNFSIEFLLL